jgi:hypothetical protein
MIMDWYSSKDMKELEENDEAKMFAMLSAVLAAKTSFWFKFMSWKRKDIINAVLHLLREDEKFGDEEKVEEMFSKYNKLLSRYISHYS